jgi:hypothetical protein
MLVSALDPVVGDVTTSRKTVAVLDELLAHSIRLRDAYKNARWHTSGVQFELQSWSVNEQWVSHEPKPRASPK